MLPRFGPVGQQINPEDIQFGVHEGVCTIDEWTTIALGTVDGISSTHPIAGPAEAFAIYVGALPSLVQWNLAFKAELNAEEVDFYDVRLVNFEGEDTTEIRRVIAEFRLPYWVNSESGTVRDYFRLVELPPSQPGFQIAPLGLQVLCGDSSTIQAFSSFQRMR